MPGTLGWILVGVGAWALVCLLVVRTFSVVRRFDESVVVDPPLTVTLWVTLWKPLADATNWTVPTGTPFKV